MTREATIRVLDAPRCHLGEGPSYDPATDTAWWVDILERRMFEMSLTEGAGPARVHDLPFMISHIAAIDGRRQLLAGEDGLYIRNLGDGRLGYFVDTKEGVLRRVAVDPATGLPAGEPETHYHHGDGPGGIDGAAVDADGVIWTARFGAACLDAYSPAGDRIRTVAVPPRQPTCPTFAGRHLDQLLVTSAYEGLDEAGRAADPEHGRTLLVGIGARGVLEPPFRLTA